MANMQYNRALDFLVSAAVKTAQGKYELAAKCLIAASRQPSFAKAIQILEASNERAFQLQAKAAAERRRVTAAEEAEDAELDDLVGDLGDLGGDDDMGGEEAFASAERAPEEHPAVDEGVPTEMLEKQAKGKDTIAARNKRFAAALASTAARGR
jgi:hypothetical protein